MLKSVWKSAAIAAGSILCAATLSSASAASFVSFANGSPGTPGDGIILPLTSGLAQPFDLGSCGNGITVTVFPADPGIVFNGPEDFVSLGISSPGGGSGTGVAYSGTTTINGVQGYYFNVSQGLLQFIAQIHTSVFGVPTTVADLRLTGLGFGLDYGAIYLGAVDAVAIGCGQNALPPANQPPVVDAIAPSASLVPIDTVLSMTADFIDPDAADAFSVSWDWGDGTTSAGAVSGDNASGTATANGTHAYSTPGVYQVKVQVADAAGAIGEASYQYIVVYDPSGGFVTGGGWIASPAGAYRADPSASGKASFGFVAKYQPGKTAPVGNTEFQFKSGNLNFKSGSYEWLVVSGAKAQYKGHGTVNGSGNYRFLLSAVDGDLLGNGIDRFRIRIWQDGSDTGTDAELVYDNQASDPAMGEATTALGGGSIIVHR